MRNTDNPIARIVIAGTGSGVGKTTVTTGLCAAFRSLGLRVSVFKCGPDYLDPTYHFQASGVRSQTLDSWLMGREGVLSTFGNAARESDIALIEGMMGLFDGAASTSNAGSTAEIAKWLGAPVLLVVDASGMSRSVAAMAQGFASFDPELQVAGVLCNRIGGRSHLGMLVAASQAVPVLGGFPRDSDHAFPERHLGLITACDASLPSTLFDVWGRHAAEWCDIERILQIARTAPALESAAIYVRSKPRYFCRIGMALDDAFHFYYDENLRLLEEAGAELVRFSPITASRLPDVDGLYLGGGYPEVHARALADNEVLRRDILRFCRAGKPVYAECGGLMYLCDEIRDLDGSLYPMVGWFGANAVMSSRMQALGYVEVTTRHDTILGPAGRTFRGHQFRYSMLQWKETPHAAYDVSAPSGQCRQEGYSRGCVLGSYVHAHWSSNPETADSFVGACAATRAA